MSIAVLLADHHAVIREGLAQLLQAQADIRVVGMAADGRAAVREAIGLNPDVAVMDSTLPVLNGIDATEEIRDHCPDTEVLILSLQSSAEHVFRALRAGALGYVLKESAASEVIAGVRSVFAGRRYLGARIADTITEDYLRQRHASSPLDSLNPRERQILQLLAAGKSSAEGAAILAIPHKSVVTHRRRLMQKLGIGDLPSLLRFAHRHGLTRLD